MNEMLDAALLYIERGFSPCPVAPSTKRPPARFRWKRLQRQPMSEDEARRVWDGGSPPDLALVMGPGGLWCIDNDKPERVETLIHMFRHLTWMELTPRGCHLFVRSTTPVASSKVDGIDVKGHGSLVVVSPSADYKMVSNLEPLLIEQPDAWLSQLLRDLGLETQAEERSEAPGTQDILSGRRMLEAGERNDWMFRRLGSVLRRYGGDARVIYGALKGVNPLICREPLPDDELQEIARKVERAYEPTHPRILAENAEQSPESTNGDAWVDAADVEPREPAFLWGLRLVQGSVNLLVGEPSSAKSIATTDLVARITTGGSWPDGHGNAPPGDVIMLCAEDPLEEVVVPRLIRHGADLDRVHLLRSSGRTDMTAHLQEALTRWPSTILVAVDPLLSYVDAKLDITVSPQVRQLLHGLSDLVAETDAALLGLVHLRKDQEGSVLTRILGSVEFRAVARSILASVRDPSGELVYYLAHVKSNYGLEEPTLRYRIDGPPAKGAVVWEGETEANIETLIMTPASGNRDGRLQQATALLRELLADSPRPQPEIEAAAREQAISGSTLWRAKQAVGVKSKRHADHWTWSLRE